ncbi:MAG: tryptophan synthase subunit alpha [Sterolibacterium sp.]|nr:tryptophan synthase subunit alpha [Sterolibacterium sp.]
MSRIPTLFDTLAAQGRKALIPFMTAGFPGPAHTLPLMRALVAGGADLIELGVPFSDPMADGPTVQRASEVALAQGMTLRGVLDIVRSYREEDTTTPIVLMGYANPVEAYGCAALARDAAAAGVDGLLVVDYPPEEADEFVHCLRQHQLDPIFLLAPTSTEARFAQVAELGSGYIYYVSLKGVTGSGALDLDEVARRIPLIRSRVGMPVGVGFGIRDAASAARIGAVADAVVIGSRIIEEIETAEHEAAGSSPARVQLFMQGIRSALDHQESQP